MKEKVAVAMSGGVDSSVSAYLLKQKGYDVTGVFITVWTPQHIPCSAIQDREDAMRACAALSIPFIEFDATDIYKEKVIDPFVDSYRHGETPNPDVLCNTFVKFDAAFHFIRDKGFQYMATGHYARVCMEENIHRLYSAVDPEKDQTYFTYTMSDKVLPHIFFPVGGYTKAEVRRIAEKKGLPSAHKSDSVGLCFLGDISMTDFLSLYIPPAPGAIYRYKVPEQSVGEHKGAAFYTIGQRIAFEIHQEDGPFFVYKKDMDKNVIWVASEDELRNFSKTSFRLKNVFFREKPVGTLSARYRHRGPLEAVSLGDSSTNEVEVIFNKPQLIAPGQSIVLYGEKKKIGKIGSGRVCFGGGVVS